MTRSRASFLLAAAIAWAGCGDDGAMPVSDAGPADGGPACATWSWQPGSGNVTRWPEPALVEPDPSTATGVRLVLDGAEYPEIVATASGFSAVLTEDLRDVDGFGVNSEAFFMFEGPFDEARLPSGEATASAAAGVGIVVLEPGSPRLQPVLVRTTDRGSTLMLAPMRPLPEQGRAVAFVTRALQPATLAGCLEPAPALADELASPSADVSDAIAALRALGVIAEPSELVALTVFPTQSITGDSEAVAADVAMRSFALAGPATCTTEARYRRCETSFVAGDYRNAEGFLSRNPGDPVAPRVTYEVPVTFWLPLPGAGSAPYPTLVYGHGLGSGRDQGGRLADFAAPLGIATVAIDAVGHGEHPTHADPAEPLLQTVLGFFAIGDLSARAIHGLRLRDNFRQSSWDKLQLTRVLETGPDVDGDAMPDVDPSRLAYLGVSLGGIMGPEVLALTETYGAAVLVVPGGRVTAILSDSETFGALVVTLRPRGVTEGDVRRFFPILQTVIDRGDPASYAPHVLVDRLAPSAMGPPPSVLLGVVLDDDTVPNLSNYTLARAFDVPIVPPVLRPEPGLAAAPAAPLSGNVAGGTATAGLLQFDVIRDDDGSIDVATHSNVGDSEVGAAAWLGFLRSHWDAGLAEIIDPYVATGLTH